MNKEAPVSRSELDILHVVAHVGGGVGAVLYDFFEISRRGGIVNRVLCLDNCKDRRALVAADFWSDGCWDLTSEQFNERVAGCDAVIWHFWNHPLTSYALHNWNGVGAPSMVWSHNSGLYEPHIIPSYLGGMMQRIVFSSECSEGVPNRDALACNYLSRCQVVHSSRSLENFIEVQRQNLISGAARRAIYVGTVSFAKMHEDSVEILMSLARGGLDVRVVGGGDQVRTFRDRMGTCGRIEVIGPVEDVRDHLAWGDIFVYPLRKDHYGTGEQVLLEAMASGLPIVAFSNPAERAIVSDRRTGRLVQNSKEFVTAVISLSADDSLREQMGDESRRRAMECFGARRMVEGLIKNVQSVAAQNRCGRNLNRPFVADLGLYLFVRNSFHDKELHEVVAREGVPSAMRVFDKIRPHLSRLEDAVRWTGTSKSTPRQYLMYFPGSGGLRDLCRLVDQEIDVLHGGRLGDSCARASE